MKVQLRDHSRSFAFGHTVFFLLYHHSLFSLFGGGEGGGGGGVKGCRLELRNVGDLNKFMGSLPMLHSYWNGSKYLVIAFRSA